MLTFSSGRFDIYAACISGIAWGAAAFYALPTSITARANPFYLITFILVLLAFIILLKHINPLCIACICTLTLFLLGLTSAAFENRAHPSIYHLQPREGAVAATIARATPKGKRIKMILRDVVLDEGPGPYKAPCDIQLTAPLSFFTNPDAPPLPGERFYFPRIRLKPPSGPSAPNDYDSLFHKRLNGICLSGYPLTPATHLSSSPRTGIWDKIEHLGASLRHVAAQAIRDDIKSEGPAGLLVALLTNLRGYVTHEDEIHFRAAGITHLLAISGSHIALAAGLAFWLARNLLIRIPYMAQTRNIRGPAAICAVTAAGLFVWFVNAPISAVRALTGAALFFIASSFYLRIDAIRIAAAVASTIALISPHTVTTPGFGMSFFAACSIVAIFRTVYGTPYDRARKRERHSEENNEHVIARAIWSRVLRNASMLALSGIAAGIATAPFSLYYFGEISISGFLANLIAVPLTALFIMPPALTGLCLMPFGMHTWPLFLTVPGLTMLEMVGSIGAAWNNNLIHLHAPETAAFTLWCLAIACFVFNSDADKARRLPGHLAALALAALGTFFYLTQPQPIVYISGKSALVGFVDHKNDVLWTNDMRKDRRARRTWQLRSGLARSANAVSAGSGSPRNIQCTKQGCLAMLGALQKDNTHSQTIIAAKTSAYAALHCMNASYGVSLTREAEQGFSGCPELPVISYEARLRHGAYVLYLNHGTFSAETAAR